MYLGKKLSPRVKEGQSGMEFDVTIVGAGPYGLSSSIYLKKAGQKVGIFGEAMSFWEKHMPAGMFLRSNWRASHIADPDQKLTLDHFQAERGRKISIPIPLEDFVAYGQWYQQKGVPDLDRRQVAFLEKNGTGFKVTLDDGEVIKSRRVAIATGIAPFPYRPEEFAALPPSHVTHTSDHRNLGKFRGQQILVVGGGQSALDAGRILQKYDATVEVVAKQKVLHWVGGHAKLHKLGLISKCLYSPYDVGPAGISKLVGWPLMFRKLPRGLQDTISHRATRPAGSAWMIPHLKNVRMTLNTSVVSTTICGKQVQVKLSDGTERTVDHVILATGYRVDTARYHFFSDSLQKALRTVRGYPVLGRGMESSIPGLHFIGKPAAWSYGPLLNFISGAEFGARELLRGFS